MAYNEDQKASILSLGSVGTCQALLEKKICISIKLVRRWKHEVLQKLLVDVFINFGLHAKHSGPNNNSTPNHHKLKTSQHFGFFSSLFHQTKTLLSKGNFKLTFIWKHYFRLTTLQFLSFNPGKMFLMSLLQEWLDISQLLLTSLSRLWSSLFLCTSSYHAFPFLSVWSNTLTTARLFNNGLLSWLSHHAEGDHHHHLVNCQVSSLPCDCGCWYWTKLWDTLYLYCLIVWFTQTQKY